MTTLPLLAVLAGAAIALQAGMNAKLGVVLKNPLFATGLAFLLACIFTFTATLITQRHIPSLLTFKAVPVYLWFGGVLSAFGVGISYYLIPKMGVGSMMSYALAGQLILAVVASHFGWFQQPINPINTRITLGVAIMIIGVFLINGGNPNGH